MRRFRAAVAQVRATLCRPDAVAKVRSFAEQAGAGDAELVVFPEALLGGYPRGAAFGAVIGDRSSSGRDEFLAYSRNAVTVPGPRSRRWERSLVAWACISSWA